LITASISACLLPKWWYRVGAVTPARSQIARDEIRAWREKLAAAFDYTVRVLRTEGEYRVTAQVAGDFPGSPVELTYDFRLRDGLIAELVIG
jgi:hypothetical protein